MIDPESWIGKQIGHYVIQKHIQRGGMADVFLAYDEWLERPSAIKVLFPTLGSDPDFVKRFQREAKTVARLRHHHIVQIFTTDVTDDGHYYIAMEYIPGGTLQDKLVELSKVGKLLDTPTAIGIVHQIAEALDVAHRAGVVHRDIKPSNILLREDGTPVLTDLGIAQVQDKPGLTRTHALVGTPTYMSPEQATTSHVDGRSDIYSLGVIFYELFSGRRLFDGDTPWAVLNQHLNTPPRPITEIRPDITYTTWLVLQKCLEKDPNYRYQTAAELLHALDEALVAERAADQIDALGTWVGTQPGTGAHLITRENIIQRTPIPATQIASPVSETAVAPPQTPPPAARKRPSWLIPALIVLLLAVFVGGAFAAGPLRQALLPPTPTITPMIIASATDAPVAQAAIATATPTETPFDEVLAALSTLEAALSATPIPSHTPTATDTPAATETATPTETATRTPTATRTAGATVLATAPAAATSAATGSSGGSSNPVGNASSGEGLPLGFENFGLWVRGNEANGSFTRSTEQARSGAASGKLEYHFDTPDNDYVVFMQNNTISGNPTALQVWVYGDGSGHFLNAWIQDAGRQTWQVPFGRVIHTGWRQMTGYIDTGQSWPWTIISGGNDPNVDYPISFRGFVLDDKDNAYTGQGVIYLDDLTATTLSPGGPTPTPSSATPTPGGTAVPTSESSAPVNPGTVGRILYSSGNTLLTTDPAWSSPVELGTIASDTCNNPANTVSGQSYNLYFGPFCGIISGGTTVCAAPNGQMEVITNQVGENSYSISLRAAGATDTIFVYQGAIDRPEGIRWSPTSNNFLFVVGDTVHQAFLNGSYNQIIPTAFEPRFSQDGSMILYRKPIGPGVNDIFVANSDGSNQRNVTNVATVDKRCAVWKN
ncbi:MAG: protein kinase [Anaerolineae bacterium]|nr:protein kinase [Anaerolineae bacterium]